jgi:hypothetical protein
MKTLEILIQNITWSVPKALFFEQDGKFVLNLSREEQREVK